MFNVIYGDLFDHVQDRTPLHCIASDHAMGAGIAVPMAEKYRLRAPMDEVGMLPWPSCLYIGGVLNMVTKEKSWEKPTFENFSKALSDVPKRCEYYGIEKIVMPKIGCGLDGLDWEKVRALVEKELEGLDILVCIPPSTTAEQAAVLKEFERQVSYAKGMLEDGMDSVYLLGYKFTKAERLSETLDRIKRWRLGKFEGEEDYDRMIQTCRVFQARSSTQDVKGNIK